MTSARVLTAPKGGSYHDWTKLLPAVRAFRAALALLPLAAASAHAAVPADFSDTLVASVGGPTALAFTPDGRMLVTTQQGALRVYQGSTLLGTAFTFGTGGAPNICSNSERGLLGVAVDPSFASNGFIYLYYSFRTGATCGPAVNRASRFVLTSGNTVSPSTETVLVDNMPSTAGNHNGGDLHFGKDGYLYVSVGDGGCDYAPGGGCAGANDASRDQHILLGKILRVTRDGGIPPDNPFQGPDSARCNVTGRTTAGQKCQETFAWGLRNPFRIAFDPNAAGTRFFVNDVGQNTWEEIDLGLAGADYGWNVREGLCPTGSTTNCGPPPVEMTNPIFAYGHGAGCTAITGGAFVPDGVFPSAYDGGYLFGDYGCGTIFQLTESGGTYSASEFATALGSSSAVHMTFGPFGSTQALYYTTYAAGGQVRRIAYTGSANRTPVAALVATPTSGPAPLTVTLDGNGSSDPDGDALTYLWDFGDTSPAAETATDSIQHTYTEGSYVGTLRVRDGAGEVSAPVTVTIAAGGTSPLVTIVSPAPDARFRVGETITLRGTATDAQDGTMPAGALSWTVILHHASHVHPFLGPVTGTGIALTAPAPEDLLAATNSYLEVRLSVTDSSALTTTAVRDLLPRTVDLTFDTIPRGMRVDVAGRTLGPNDSHLVVSWEGATWTISAPAQTGPCGQTAAFLRWSDGGAATHAITTPAVPTSYIASFEVASARCLVIDDAAVAEGSAANAAFRVYLSEPTSSSVSVQYATADGTAVTPSDYGSQSGTLTFTPNRTEHTVVVPIVTDAAAEGPETFSVVLSNPVNATIRDGEATATITDPPAPVHAAMYRAYNRNADYHFFTTDAASRDFAVGLGYQDESNPVPFHVLNVMDATAVPLFRMYNPNLGRHYYTADAGSRDFLMSIGMTYEKDEGFVQPTPVPGTTELFRLYNNNSGTHLFIADATQKDGILALFPGVWVQHTSVGYVFTSP